MFIRQTLVVCWIYSWHELIRVPEWEDVLEFNTAFLLVAWPLWTSAGTPGKAGGWIDPQKPKLIVLVWVTSLNRGRVWSRTPNLCCNHHVWSNQFVLGWKAHVTSSKKLFLINIVKGDLFWKFSAPICSLIYTIIHFIKQLFLNTYHMLGTLLPARDSAMNEMQNTPTFVKVTFRSVREMINKII